MAKTVADCFKFRNKLGLGVARQEDERDELWRYAKVSRVANVMRWYLEAVA